MTGFWDSLSITEIITENKALSLSKKWDITVSAQSRSVARKETLDVHQKNWVCHIYCQINAKKKKKACLLGINMLV